MFMRIVQRLNGKMVYLYIRLCTLVKEHLLLNANNLLAKFSQALQDAASQLVKIAQNLKTFLVSRIIADQLPKQEPINARHLATQLGLQPQTIVPQIRQLVVTAQSRKKDKSAASTKSARSRTKKKKTVQTPMDLQSIADGLKSDAVAKQLRQRVKQQLKVKP